MTFLAKFILFIILVYCEIDLHAGFAQKVQNTKNYKQVCSIKNNLDFLENIVLEKLNNERTINNLEVFKKQEILELPAESQSKYMSRINELLDVQTGRKKYATDRMVFFGGSKKSKELILQIDFDYNSKLFSLEKIADKIVKRLTVLNYYKQLTLNPDYFFIGIAISANKQCNSLFVTIVLGNYQSFNSGLKEREELHIPFYASFYSNNIRNGYGFLPYDKKECLSVSKIKNIDDLIKGLYIKNNSIYFSQPNTKLLKRVLKSNNDRLAVDIIPHDLYDCNHENLIDNNQINKGVLIKGLTKKQIFRQNLNNKKSTGLNVKLGNLRYKQDLSGPRIIDGKPELNLYVIKNKHICKIITPAFNEFNNIKQNNASGLMVDTTLTESIEFIENELFRNTSSLVFNIPFKKNKYEYKKSDIEPLLKVLNEPKFQIKSIKITAYSSIEGSEKNNDFLQNARAKSIVKVFQKLSVDTLKYIIRTSNSWEQFKLDILNTEFDTIASMPKKEALNYISQNKLMNKLEPILQKERYAHIELKILYDTTATSKEKLIINKINKYIRQNYVNKAELIHKYFIKEIMNGKYNRSAIHEILIPDKPKFAKIKMNQLWLEKYVSDEWLYDTDYQLIEHIFQQNGHDFYILYNYLYVQLQFITNINTEQINRLKEGIEILNKFHIKNNLMTALKFRLLLTENRYIIAHGSRKEKLEMLKKIEKIISNENEAIEIAKILASSADYDYAIKLLSPFIGLPDTSDKLLFTYIALCSHNRKMFYTKVFEKAAKQIMIRNAGIFCNLVKSNKITLQVLENPVIKKLYCERCK